MIKKTFAFLLIFTLLLCGGLASFATGASAAVSEITYTAVFYDNGDGMATIKVLLPDYNDNYNGKVVLSVSNKLTYVSGSLASEIGGAIVNESYDRDGYAGLMCNYSAAENISGGTAILVARFSVANGAVVTAADFDVVFWKLGQSLGTPNGSGEVIKQVIYGYTVDFVVDGTVISSQLVKVGKAAIAPNAPEKEGYIFIGWDKAFDLIIEDTTVNALFERESNCFVYPDGVKPPSLDFDDENGYMIYYSQGYLISDLKEYFFNEEITVYNPNGTVREDGRVGTGCTVVSVAGDETKSYTAVVCGDINGDGLVTTSDYAQALAASKGKLTLSGAKFAAANVAKASDGKITSADYAMILAFAKGNFRYFGSIV